MLARTGAGYLADDEVERGAADVLQGDGGRRDGVAAEGQLRLGLGGHSPISRAMGAICVRVR